MNINTTSQYMDKQIMDLSNSQSSVYAHNSNSGSNNDFIDLINRPAEKKGDVTPIRPSSPTAGRSSNLDSGNGGGHHRTWNSADSHVVASPVRNYSSTDAVEPAEFILGRNHNVSLDASLASGISSTMEKHMDNLMHAVDKMSARLSHLETRTRNIESSIDALKTTAEKNHGTTDGKMRLLENVLTEVQTGVQFIRDKHETFEAQLQTSKLHVPKAEHVEAQNAANPGPIQTAGLSLSSHQQFPNVPLTQPPTLPLSNVLPQQSAQSYVQLPNLFPQNQGPPNPQQDPYFTAPSQDPKIPNQQYQNPSQQFQNPENPNQQFQNPEHPSQQYHNPEHPSQQYHNPEHPSQQYHNPEHPNQQYQNPPPPHNKLQHPDPPHQHQYQPPPQPQYPHPPFSTVSLSSLPQPPVTDHPEETPYMPSQTNSQRIRPPYGQYYGSNLNIHEPPSSRIGPGPGYSGSFGTSSGREESGYPQLPTARILPQALPTASAVGGTGSGSGSGNRVPIDDVVDRVTTMGFSRDQVRATVRRLTENGQAVDLNIVLDKLMNDG